MARLWRRLRAMPDRERARVLAIVSGSLIIGLLYGLGGLSLYLRAHYLQPTPTPMPIVEGTLPPLEEEGDVSPTLFPTMTPTGPASAPTGDSTPTLFPTLTPKPGA